MTLSILIPTTPDREPMLNELLVSLGSQIEKCNAQDKVEILLECDNREKSVGAKRQSLLERATGEYSVFIDDDDEVSADYLFEILNAIETYHPDVIGYEGYMTTNMQNRENFKISKDLPYTTVSNSFGVNEYLRYNNHLCPIKRNIALKIGFKDMKFAEDFTFASELKNSFLIKTETYIAKDLYHYKYVKNK